MRAANIPVHYLRNYSKCDIVHLQCSLPSHFPLSFLHLRNSQYVVKGTHSLTPPLLRPLPQVRFPSRPGKSQFARPFGTSKEHPFLLFCFVLPVIRRNAEKWEGTNGGSIYCSCPADGYRQAHVTHTDILGLFFFLHSSLRASHLYCRCFFFLTLQYPSSWQSK